jgi:hypothetical protein
MTDKSKAVLSSYRDRFCGADDAAADDQLNILAVGSPVILRKSWRKAARDSSERPVVQRIGSAEGVVSVSSRRTLISAVGNRISSLEVDDAIFRIEGI